MTEIRFYHLQTQSLDQALPQILSKAYETGKNIVVKLPQDTIDKMDQNLWTYNPDSFLPHGTKRDAHEELQPIFLTETDDNPNDAKILVTGLGAIPNDPEKYDLCCEMLDGRHEQAVSDARIRWKSYQEAGHEVTYWFQDQDGRWTQKA